ncbi:hypothetical protein XELAEV_18019741mg [Xenopus laevis]|uniref:Uncharacterized protein n=1 Tax=Xenopus laevis TaxID=8355 RepID=A0A974D6D1_XENLA|nr:hypothetical protein XELAEV_18019741mg [Xenopus laevis]
MTGGASGSELSRCQENVFRFRGGCKVKLLSLPHSSVCRCPRLLPTSCRVRMVSQMGKSVVTGNGLMNMKIDHVSQHSPVMGIP